MVSAILACAGSGDRANFGYNKLLKPVDGIPVFAKTLYTFVTHPLIDEIIVVCAEQDERTFSDLAERIGAEAIFVRGGKTRSESILAGVKAASGDVVVTHDGARPFVSARVISDCITSAVKYGSGVACVPATDTIAQISYDGKEKLIVSAGRENLYNVQTPQAFKKDLILKAFSLDDGSVKFTDESGLFAKYIGRCHLVDGDTDNKKLTYAEDFSPSGNLRAGTGFDLHRLTEGRKLFLGGIEIPHAKGLLGHSDADVLLHAIMDALLSSASLGDIGKLFPDTAPEYEGISSEILYAEVIKKLRENGFEVVNISAVIMAEKPRLSSYTATIAKNIARLSGINEKEVGISCTTLEGIGVVGREEGIAVQAYCLTRNKRLK